MMNPVSISQNEMESQPGLLELLDPFGNVLARIPSEQLHMYLKEHGLESEMDLGIEPRFPEDYRKVFDTAFHSVLSRIYDFPRMMFIAPRLPNEPYRLDSQLYSKKEFQAQVAGKLNSLLQVHPFAVYEATLWESESLELPDWRRWVESELLPLVFNAELALPPGSYPSFKGAMFRRRNAPPIEEYLLQLPRGGWVDPV